MSQDLLQKTATSASKKKILLLIVASSIVKSMRGTVDKNLVKSIIKSR